MYAWDRLVHMSDEAYIEDAHHIVSRTAANIGIILTSIRTTGHRHNMQKNKCAVQNTNHLAVTSVIRKFFAKHPDYTLIVPCGSETHQQCVFLRKEQAFTKIAAKVYDANGKKDLVLCSTTIEFLAKLNQSENGNDLMYTDALHRLTNPSNGKYCATYVWLEILLAYTRSETPFNRIGLQFHRAKKSEYGLLFGNVGRFKALPSTIVNLNDPRSDL